MNLPKNKTVLATVSVNGLNSPYYALAYFNDATNYWQFADGGSFRNTCISMRVVSWKYCDEILESHYGLVMSCQLRKCHTPQIA